MSTCHHLPDEYRDGCKMGISTQRMLMFLVRAKKYQDSHLELATMQF